MVGKLPEVVLHGDCRQVGWCSILLLKSSFVLTMGPSVSKVIKLICYKIKTNSFDFWICMTWSMLSLSNLWIDMAITIFLWWIGWAKTPTFRCFWTFIFVSPSKSCWTPTFFDDQINVSLFFIVLQLLKVFLKVLNLR